MENNAAVIEAQTVAFDGRTLFYKELYAQIERFNTCYLEDDWEKAINHLEAWGGLLTPFMRDKKLWDQWHDYLIDVAGKMENNWQWDDYNERWNANTDKIVIPDIHNQEQKKSISRREAIREIQKCLNMLRDILIYVMHEKKMLLPEKEAKNYGHDLLGARYG